MAKLDKMLQDARALKTAKTPYQPLCIIEKLESDQWSVQGFDGATFDTQDQAMQFCENQAAGRRVSVVFFDIPRILPDGDYVIPDGESEVDLIAAANANSNGHSPGAPAHF